MASVEAKDFSTAADEVMTPSNARIEVVNVGGQRVMKLTAQPGWKWSNDIKPMVGTESCQKNHVGVCVQGKLMVTHEDGSSLEVGPGDAYTFAPGHDAWVVGNEPVVAYEFGGAWGE